MQIFTRRNTLVLVGLSWVVPIVSVLPIPFISSSGFLDHRINSTIPIGDILPVAECYVKNRDIQDFYVAFILTVKFGSCAISVILYIAMLIVTIRIKRSSGN